MITTEELVWLWSSTPRPFKPSTEVDDLGPHKGEWNEEDHPRDDDGRFGSGSGGGDSYEPMGDASFRASPNYIKPGDKEYPAASSGGLPTALGGMKNLMHPSYVDDLVSQSIESGTNELRDVVGHDRLEELGRIANDERFLLESDAKFVFGVDAKAIKGGELVFGATRHMALDTKRAEAYAGDSGVVIEAMVSKGSRVVFADAFGKPEAVLLPGSRWKVFGEGRTESGMRLIRAHLVDDGTKHVRSLVERANAIDVRIGKKYAKWNKEKVDLGKLLKGEWNEEDHPRDDDGKFGSGSGGEKPASTVEEHLPSVLEPGGNVTADDIDNYEIWLQGGFVGGGESKDLNDSLDKLPVHTGDSYRGVAFESMADVEAKFKKGSTFIVDFNSSASKSIGVAREAVQVAVDSKFGNYPVIITVRNGNTAADLTSLPGYDKHDFGYQKEVVLRPGSRYKVLVVSLREKFGDIYVKEVKSATRHSK